ncbi:TniQ family protein [Brevibacillus laterosporus]|uniref:TniQ family protein n=1 Tax=Brevibacillus laterosporus TaxID=1465 RepID=UPI000D472C17|nr:TniQ family protein [Brevibacillus laterosporus]MED1662770.1 TniQ family protein [Brevibacillus laterosporus]MED1669104.1 TniQ family protein [Brevibacillus laterosporus]MED1720579.1 TniQ family protein [Brevibacillus laterosporus]PPA88355.1 hypothetical protein C4A76_08340 [Brevibacillus laterosporus]
MISKFTIRPMPKSGESLTGYLMRIVHRNFVSLNSLLTSVHNGGRRRTDHQIDILSERVINLEALSGIVGVTLSQLRAMTFQSVVEKYVDHIDTSQDYPAVMRDATDKIHRRFCPECLQEDGVLKLIWQVKEVEICDKHHVSLTSKCPVCTTDQPFLSKNLAVLRCFSCGSKLASHGTTKIEDTDLIAAQLRVYSDWRYLMNPSFSSLVSEIQNYPKEKSLAIAVVYLLQGKPESYNPESTPQPQLRKLTQGLVRKVRDDCDQKRVSVLQSLSILRRLDLKPSEIQRICIPDAYISSLYPSKYSFGPCLAPWCRFYSTSNGMERIIWKHCFEEGKIRYAYPSVCRGCYMRYGISDNQWNNVPVTFCDGIELAQKVRELLETGASHKQITQELKIRYSQLSRIAGYLAYHQLLDDSVAKHYTPQSLPNNILECVKKIGPFVSEIGQAKAKKLYGWKTADFYYYMATSEVQAYFSMDEKSKVSTGRKTARKRVITEEEAWKLEAIIEQWKMSDTRITFQGLAKALNCPAIILHVKPYEDMVIAAQTEQKFLLHKREKNMLRKRVRDFIDSKLQSGEPIIAFEIYAHIGRGVNHLKRHFPWLRKWITLVAKKDQETRIIEKKEELIDGVYLAVEQIAATSSNLNLDDIANHLGVSRNTLKLYGEVTEAINQAKLRYKIGVVKNKIQ